MGNTFTERHTQRLHEAKAEVSTAPRLSSHHLVRQKGNRTQCDALLLQIREDRSQVGVFFLSPHFQSINKVCCHSKALRALLPTLSPPPSSPFLPPLSLNEFLQQLPICGSIGEYEFCVLSSGYLYNSNWKVWTQLSYMG